MSLIVDGEQREKVYRNIAAIKNGCLSFLLHP